MTKIEWTDKSWNPVTGCTPISPGCKNCYAKRMARRLAGRYGYPKAPHHFDVTLRPDRLEQPLKWKKPRMVFVCSMSDPFHDDVPFSFLDIIWRRMDHCAHCTFQVLTKRPARMLEYFEYRKRKSCVMGLHFSNVWLGVTAENQAIADERTQILCQIPAAVRFLSVDPMLGQIELSQSHKDFLNGWDAEPVHVCGGDEVACYQRCPEAHQYQTEKLDWVIVGAETGPGKRPMPLRWARSLRAQCQAAGVPFFFKKDSQGNRTLDGRLWEEMPQ